MISVEFTGSIYSLAGGVSGGDRLAKIQYLDAMSITV